MELVHNRVGFEPSKAFASVGDWMQRAIDGGQPISAEQVACWAAAVRQASARAEALQAVLGDLSERVDAACADRIREQAVEAVTRLAHLAADAATRAELKEIDARASLVFDTLEALTFGVARPQEQENAHG